jgi:hypothetical protein
MVNEFVRKPEEGDSEQLKVVSRHFIGRSEENHDKPQSG